MVSTDFLLEDEKNFLEKGYIIKNINSKDKLNEISNIFYESSIKIIESDLGYKNPQDFFNFMHLKFSYENLNEFRVNLINKINQDNKVKNNLYELSKSFLNELVGNELAVQRRINLSIQFPRDDTSLLPVHADTWSGDSPFEIVTWLPLVDCYNTKSMYLLPPNHTETLLKDFDNFADKSANYIFEKISKDLDWIDINYGQIMLFNQSLPHGNIVNKEKETRWSLNCRFKSLFSPYGDKKLGEFFEPISTKIMTKIGMNYSFPFSK